MTEPSSSAPHENHDSTDEKKDPIRDDDGAKAVVTDPPATDPVRRENPEDHAPKGS
jgi:hypothetical protein